jgi:hypothetical protein
MVPPQKLIYNRKIGVWCQGELEPPAPKAEGSAGFVPGKIRNNELNNIGALSDKEFT